MSVFDRIKQRVGNQEDFDANQAKADIKRWREEDEAKQYDHFKKQISECQSAQAIGRSGILPMHQNCSVTNYVATTAEQHNALQFATKYIADFDNNNGGGFIFSGKPGTGKNHLAAAICNALMAHNKTCLVITITELSQKLRNCYQKDSETTEDKFIQTMINYDLLVLDEIGLQRNSESEKLALNQIIDQRICRFKPTGMLTNLSSNQINECLGVRIMDRMRSFGGKWVSFNWESFRK